MANQMEMSSVSDREDNRPIVDTAKAFTPSTRRRILVIGLIALAFTFPIVLVLAVDLPSVLASNREGKDFINSRILSNARLVQGWAFPGVKNSAPSIIPIDKLVNATELSLDTGFVISSTPAVREYEFIISQQHGAPDGFEKLMTLVNGQSPGPLIEANTGDTVRVVVHNQLSNTSTSIHWHGIDQRNSSWMDGVSGVTQCGIPAGESFTYEFTIVDQRGTFWYHAHTTLQYTDGLFGPIATTTTPPPPPCASHLLASSRWSPDITGVEPLPDNFLLNGQHTYNCSVNSTTWPAPAGASCTGGALSVVSVSPDTNVTRLRLINHSTFFSFWFSIDNHTLTTVEIDGVEVEPIADQRGVYVNVGQRYSVLVHSLPDRKGSYAMRASLPQTCFVPYCPYTSSGLQDIGYEATGLFSYPSDPEVFLGSKGNVSNPYGVENNFLRGDVWEGCDDMSFSTPAPARKRPAVEVSADNSHEVTFRFQQVGEINRIFINRTSWAPLRDDATIWKVVVGANDTFKAGEGGSYSNFGMRLDQQILLLPDANQGVQIAINSKDMMEHPFHLHGHSFQIVAWGPGEFEGGTNARTSWSLDNPMRRDTVTVPAQQHVVIRFLADNSGVWALHCHVAWHMEGGMFVSLLERPDDLRALVAGMDAETREKGMGFCEGRK
ncbi:multicopper oxidase-domain-containing protein [Coniochaeta sp. 2T2.1]|nr:multicopper oxidase-domain-containing protein [Coniochaeta sp. 2T2.1]